MLADTVREHPERPLVGQNLRLAVAKVENVDSLFHFPTVAEFLKLTQQTKPHLGQGVFCHIEQDTLRVTVHRELRVS